MIYPGLVCPWLTPAVTRLGARMKAPVPGLTQAAKLAADAEQDRARKALAGEEEWPP